MENQPDLAYVESAAKAIAPVLVGGELIILESTSPPGTTKKIAEVVGGLRPDLEMAVGEHHTDKAVHFAHCPERVLPGRIMTEMIENDRIVGGLSESSTKRAAALYSTFCKGNVLTTTAATAETAKLVENAYRDVNIAFANEIAKVADLLCLDVSELIALANHHPRVNILKPGPGVGGHCIAVDPWFLISAAPDETPLMRQARRTNDAKPLQVVEQIKAAVQESGSRSVTLMGLAYKADIDDLRESPSISIAVALATELSHLDIQVVEPHIHALPLRLSELNVTLVDSTVAAQEEGVVCVLVDHTAFRQMSKANFRATRIVDICGLWSIPVTQGPSAPVLV
jgi:UDP-N-acetyl-D-mannosaminuronic acid dehydrogenase